MPRVLPSFELEFADELAKAESYIRSLEAEKIALEQGNSLQRLKLQQVELAYELAFLRIYIALEVFLEQVFLRILCGYTIKNGIQEPITLSTGYFGTIAGAESHMLGQRNYVPWHSPTDIVRRAKRYFLSSNFEIVISSASSRLEEFSAVRHRIAHAQNHARTKFDQVTMSLASRRYAGSSAGRFLRDWDRGATPPRRWLSTIGTELASLARQICR
jgi:hypothetical protein